MSDDQNYINIKFHLKISTRICTRKQFISNLLVVHKKYENDIKGWLSYPLEGQTGANRDKQLVYEGII